MRYLARRLFQSVFQPKRATPTKRRPALDLMQLETRELYSVSPTTDLLVNTYTNSTQNLPSVASDADGNFVVAWQSSGQDGSGYGVYAQRFNAAGVAQGTEFKVNTYTTNHQYAPAVAMDADGTFVIVWASNTQESSTSGIYGQLYNSDGTVASAEIHINTYTTGAQVFPAVAMDSDGDFVVTWSGPGTGDTDGGIFAQRFTSSGTVSGSEFRVNTYTTNSQAQPAVAMDAVGNFVITWQSSGQDASGWGVYAQRYDSTGTAQGSEFLVNTYTTSGQTTPAVGMDASGNFVIAWGSPNGLSSNDVYAQRYNASGAAQGSEFRVNSYTSAQQDLPAVAVDQDGDFVIVWTSYGQEGLGKGFGVYAQRYSADGTATGSEFLVNNTTNGGQGGTNPGNPPINATGAQSVAMDADGNFVTAWSGNGPGDSAGIFIVGGNGAPVVITTVATDTGSSSTDRLTNDTTLTFSGTAFPGSTVALYRAGGVLVGSTTASGSGSWSVVDGTTLAEGVYRYFAVSTYGSWSAISSQTLVTVDTTGPTVGVSAPTSTYDTTPSILITAADLNGITGTFALDVDLNNDGDFLDVGETGYLTGTFTYGAATVELTPALAIGTYQVRARALDAAGNQGTSATSTIRVADVGVLAWSTTTTQSGTKSLATTGDPRFEGNVHVEVDIPWAGLTPDCGCQDPELVYNSNSVDVKPVIAIDLQSDNATALPPSIVAVLTWDGSIVGTTTYSTTGRSPGDLLNLAVQVPTAQTGVGRHTWSVSITMDYTSSPDVVKTASGQTFVAAQDSSPYGAGWTFSNVDRLYSIAASGSYPAGILRVTGNGGWSFYESTMSGYTSPAGDSGTLVASGGGWVYTYANGNSRTFNSSGMQTAWTGLREAETFTYTYIDADSDGQTDDVRTMTGPDGVIGTFTYASNKLQTVTSGPLTTTLVYSGSNLNTVTLPENAAVHTFAYSGSKLTSHQNGPKTETWTYSNGMAATNQQGSATAGQLTPAAAKGLGTLTAGTRYATWTDPVGAVTQTAFDTYGNVTEQIAADGGVITLTRDPATGWVTAYTDELGRTTNYTLNSAGNPTRIVYPDGSVVTATYDALQDQTTSIDPLNRTTSYVYDGSGRLTSMTDPAGGTTTYTWSSGLVQTQVDPLNRTTTYLYDSKRRLETIIDPLGKRTTYVYDSAGRVSSVKDPLGRVTTSTYDGVGRMLTSVDPLGKATTYTYDGAGDLLTMKDPLGRTTTYTYNDRGLRVTETDPLGKVTTTAYDAAGRVSTITDPLGRVTTYSYDGNGRLVAVTDPAGGIATTVYDRSGQVSSTLDPTGIRTQFGYDNQGRLITTTDAAGAVSTTVYDVAGQVTATIDPLGHRTTFTYDGAGRTETVKDPTGAVSTTVYDLSGQVKATVDALGRRTTFTYDGAGRTETVKDPTGAVMTTVYDAAGQVTATIDALGRRTSFTYDLDGRTETVKDPTGAVMTTVYDAAGQVTATVDALGRRTTFTYDLAGRTETTKDGTGAVWTTVYDAAGQMTAQIDPLGHRTTFTYDGAGRTIGVKDALGRVSTTVYDAAGRVTATVDALGRRTSYDYDSVGRQQTITDALGKMTTTVYDLEGRVTATVDELGRRTSYSYDAADRVIDMRDAVGYLGTTVYDAAGQVTAQVDPLGRRTTFSYDGAGRTETVKDPTGAVASTVYDAAGQVTAQVDPLGRRTTFTYDAAGRTETVKDATGAVWTTVYDSAGQTTASIDPRGNRTTFTYDAAGRTETVKDALNGVATSVYDLAGNTTVTINPRGYRTTFTYDALDRVTQVTDAAGGIATTVYDAVGNVTASVDQLGRRTTFAYDALNRVITTTNALGGAATVVYDAASQVTARTDELGRTHTYTYDLRGRQTESKDPLNGVTTTVYDGANQVTAMVDPVGNRTSYTYDGAGRTETMKDPTGAVWTTVYDAAGQVTARIDPLGRGTTFTYDAAGRTETRKDPTGAVASTVYDAVGNVSVSVDPLGHRTTFTYDVLNRVSTVKDALNGVMTTVYDANGNVTVRTDQRGYSTTITYDALDRATEVKDAVGGVTSTVYDATSNVTAMVDPLGRRTTFTYDALNRRITEKNPLGNTTSTAYDAVGNVRSVTDPLNHTTTFGYDSLNRQVTETDALNGVTSTVYDAAGRVTAIIDPVGNRTSYTYDGNSRLLTTKKPTGGVTTTVYDAAGQVTSITDPENKLTTFAYDGAGRRTGETWKAAGGTIVTVQTFTYDAAGNQTVAADPDGTYTITYDELNRVKTVKGPFATTLTFTYDAAGNRTRVDDSFGGVTTSAYDAVGRLTTRVVGGGSAAARIEYAYDLAGQLGTMSYWSDVAGPGVVASTTYAYDAGGRTTGITEKNAAATVLASYVYAYDAANRLTSKTDNGVLRTYTYDVTDQLTQDGTLTFAYDANGNRTNTGYTTGTGNRITNDGTWTYTYDATGAITGKSDGSGNAWAYVYDHQGHLLAGTYTVLGGAVSQRVTYVYDAFGNRIERSAWNGSTTVERFAVDGWDNAKQGAVGTENFDVWADLSGSNTLSARRVMGGEFDQVLAKVAGSVVTWYGVDRQGSVRQVLDNSGSVIASSEFDGYGNLIAGSLVDRYGYTGREWDSALGLYYYRARMYSPTIGRFLSEDPLAFAAGDANLYRYVGNGPTNGTDPSGMAEKDFYPIGWHLDSRTGLWYRDGTSPTSGGSTGYRFEDIPEVAKRRNDQAFKGIKDIGNDQKQPDILEVLRQSNNPKLQELRLVLIDGQNAIAIERSRPVLTDPSKSHADIRTRAFYEQTRLNAAPWGNFDFDLIRRRDMLNQMEQMSRDANLSDRERNARLVIDTVLMIMITEFWGAFLRPSMIIRSASRAAALCAEEIVPQIGMQTRNAGTASLRVAGVELRPTPAGLQVTGPSRSVVLDRAALKELERLKAPPGTPSLEAPLHARPFGISTNPTRARQMISAEKKLLEKEAEELAKRFKEGAPRAAASDYVEESVGKAPKSPGELITTLGEMAAKRDIRAEGLLRGGFDTPRSGMTLRGEVSPAARDAQKAIDIGRRLSELEALENEARSAGVMQRNLRRLIDDK